MDHLVTGASRNDDAAVVVELGDGATDLGIVASNRDIRVDNLHQLAPACLVGGGVVLELLIDLVKSVELGDEDIGATDGLGGPIIDGATIACQIDGIAVVLGVSVDVDAPADANGIDVVRYDARFA